MTEEQHLGQIWEETLGIVREQLNTPTFKTMFENACPLSLVNNVLTVSAPNAFVKEWLESRHSQMLTQALLRVTGDELGVKFVVDLDQPAGRLTESAKTKWEGSPAQAPLATVKIEVEPRVSESSPGDQTVLSVSGGPGSATQAGAETEPFARPLARFLNPKYTFDSFVIGSSNRFAHAAALAVAEKPSKAYNPLFIYGGVGLGKTHLLQAVGDYVLRHYPTLKVKYVTSERILNDFINSLRDKRIDHFRKRYRENDVLLVDDIQFLAGKEGFQEEFFHTFNTLYEAQKQIVISSDRPPKDIAALEDRLRNRFEWGLITDIQPPNLETRIAILKKKAQAENLLIPDGVYEFVAARIQSNIRELEGALIRVVAYSSHTKTPITMEMSEELLKDVFPTRETRPISIQSIQNEVCRFFNMSKVELIGSKRSQAIVYPRQIAMYLARELTDLSLPRIGQEFGGRDHTTVLHATSKIERLMAEQRDVYNQIQELTNQIKQKV